MSLVALGQPITSNYFNGEHRSSSSKEQEVNNLGTKEPAKGFLPPIENKKSSKDSDMTKPAFPESDFLPQELLVALTRKEGRTGGPKEKNGSPQVKSQLCKTSLRPPANAWSHSKQRARYKHLVDKPPCVCGAGRDISFLYDAVGSKDQSDSKSVKDSLVPAEFHVIKHPGVYMYGTEFREERYTMKTEDHMKHATVFPSLNPSSRQEVLALKQTLDVMLDKAGLPSAEQNKEALKADEEETEIEELSSEQQEKGDGPTQLHVLLELVKTEQTIYNIVFHEVIRQVSVNCVERGELLSELRRRYSELLSRVPQQIRSLHNELLAQRGLGRRLASELTEFRDQVTTLARELSSVREHDCIAMEQIKNDKETLRGALEASENNASALQDYRDVYEMQRNRLEVKISELKAERDLWQQSTYKLANKVAERQNLQSVRRLQIIERSWFNLTQHFSILLNDKDLQQLLAIQDLVQAWKEASVQSVTEQLSIDRQLKSEVLSVKKSMFEWSTAIADCTGPLESEDLYRLTGDIDRWDQVLSRQYGYFAGDALLRRQECIKRQSHLVEAWTDEALALFHRHSLSHKTTSNPDATGAEKSSPNPCGGEHEGGSGLLDAPSVDPQSASEQDLVPLSQPGTKGESVESSALMIALNKNISSFLLELGDQVAGEHGLASGLMHVGTPVEAWSQKLMVSAQSNDKRNALADQKRFHSELREWILNLSLVLDKVQSDDTVEGSVLSGLLSEAESWMKDLTGFVTTRNSYYSVESNQLHSDLTQWMVDCLLFMTQQPGDGDLELILGEQGEKVTQASLTGRSDHLFETFTDFTTTLSRSCSDVVYAKAAKQRQKGFPLNMAEAEILELKKMETECKQWVEVVRLVLAELFQNLTSLPSQDDQDGRGSRRATPTLDEALPRPNRSGSGEEASECLYVLGKDSNIHCHSLDAIQEKRQDVHTSAEESTSLPTTRDIPVLPPELMPDMQDLLVDMEHMESVIKTKTEEALAAEEKAKQTESRLQEALSRVSSLEAALSTTDQNSTGSEVATSGKKPAKNKKSGKAAGSGATPPGKL